jgi:hypothetical protein
MAFGDGISWWHLVMITVILSLFLNVRGTDWVVVIRIFPSISD